MQRTDKVAVKRKNLLKRNPTKSETVFIAILKRYKIPYKFQAIIYAPFNFFIVDFLITMKPRKIIEIDGDYHLTNKPNDRKREQIISKTRYRKYKFVRITNEQVFNEEAEKILREIYPRKARKYDENLRNKDYFKKVNYKFYEMVGKNKNYL